MGHFPWGAPHSHVMRAAFFLALLLLQDLGEGHPSSPVGKALDQPFLARRREIRVQRQRVSNSGGRQTRGKTHGDAKLHRRRIDQGQKERESSAAAAMPDQEPRVEEEDLLEEAIRERSINKYFAADPLWTGQLVASALAWALVLAAASLPPDIGRDRPILRVLAARHALGLAADVRRVLLVAADGAVNRRRIHELVGGLTSVPGAPAYLLYTAALLAWPATDSPKGVVNGLAPLLLREFFTALAAVLDLLQILGVSSEAASGPGSAARCGPRRPMPGSLSTISLLLEASLGLSLAVALLRCRNQGGTLLRRCLAALLFANFLYNRIGHISGLKEAICRRSVGGSALALLKPIWKDMEPATRQLTAVSRATLARLDTIPGGERVRSMLQLLGFLEDDAETKEA
ncbi:hypothetical protein Naga_100022g36 [Nannochloropsis gaditana]|uniref:Transmembrane protein n=1 Tax=Nannochloropsis gaditana TaxID=72520 RepID=W7UAF9_9STRA|nr:hypothetical protein Naga_100022g36 [Nannochloropsis gaditana]